MGKGKRFVFRVGHALLTINRWEGSVGPAGPTRGEIQVGTPFHDFLYKAPPAKTLTAYRLPLSLYWVIFRLKVLRCTPRTSAALL